MRAGRVHVYDHGFAESVGIPGFHRGPLIRRRERGQHDVAGRDLGEVAFDDLRLVALGSPPEVAPHRINGFPTDPANECCCASTIFVGIGRSGQIDPSQTSPASPYAMRLEYES